MLCVDEAGKRYFLHVWGKWKQYQVNSQVLQFRECTRCGYVQRRKT